MPTQCTFATGLRRQPRPQFDAPVDLRHSPESPQKQHTVVIVVLEREFTLRTQIYINRIEDEQLLATLRHCRGCPQLFYDAARKSAPAFITKMTLRCV